MALAAVKEVLLRAAVDSQYRAKLVHETDTALVGYDLTADNLTGLTEDRIGTTVNNSD